MMRARAPFYLVCGVLLGGTIVASLIFGTAHHASVMGSAHAQSQSVGPPGFAEIVDRVKPAVISVQVKVGSGAANNDSQPAESPLERFFRQFGTPNSGGQNNPPREEMMAQGSGFFISADGYAVTNEHVVEDPESLQVTTDDGKTYDAKVIGLDTRTDIALIKIEGRDFPYVKFAGGVPRIGDWVLAVGNPFGLGGTVTAGIVSARGRDIHEGPYDDFIQIDAPVNRGNSGGPTFNMEGDVIGVNTAIFTPSGGSVGIAFAVPAEMVRSVVDQLKQNGKVTRGFIGVQMQEVTPPIAETLGLASARGALVAVSEAGGPAAKSGIRAGDVISAIDGRQVADTRDLAKTISAMSPGVSAKLTVIRGGQARAIDVTLGELPEERHANAAPAPQQRGTSVSSVGLMVAPQPGGNGLVVTNV
jgi:serine protease Do